MASISEKYRKITTACFLLFYLAGTFQSPVLEALHFLSHWSHTVQQHHFHHHADAVSGHHHSILELAGHLLAPISDEPAPEPGKAEPLKKKFAECSATLPQLTPPLDAGLPQPDCHPFQPEFYYPSVPVPPPRMSAL